MFQKRLRREVNIDEMEIGFISGKSIVDAIFSARQVIKKYELAGKKFCMVFVDLEKAFDRVPWKAIWWAL